MTIIEAFEDSNLFAPYFPGDSWSNWKVFFKALFALPMDQSELEVFQQCTGRKEPPKNRVKVAYLVVGRGAGKSRILTTIGVFFGCFFDFTSFLAPGQRVTIMNLAADRKQSREDFRYCEGLIDSVPILSQMVRHRTKESIELSTRATIEVHTSEFTSVRGYSIACAICDELAYWPADGSSPDTEVVTALKPGLARVPGSLLICGSSPYSRRGALWSAHEKYFGKDDSNVLVWQADTLTMNPTFDRSAIEELYEEDPVAAEAEYGAQFRRDIESFVSREAVAGAVVPDRIELSPISRLSYTAFVDPAGGSGADSMTLGIAHKDGESSVLDCLREIRPPFSPDEVIKEFSGTMKLYGIRRVKGDRFAGEFVREPFWKTGGIQYELSEKNKSDIYRDFLPLLNSGKVQLLDHSRLKAQLIALERRGGRGGRDVIDHPPNSHDDVVNVACGALLEAATNTRSSGDTGITLLN